MRHLASPGTFTLTLLFALSACTDTKSEANQDGDDAAEVGSDAEEADSDLPAPTMTEPGALEPGALEPGALEPGALEPGALATGDSENDVASSDGVEQGTSSEPSDADGGHGAVTADSETSVASDVDADESAPTSVGVDASVDLSNLEGSEATAEAPSSTESDVDATEPGAVSNDDGSVEITTVTCDEFTPEVYECEGEAVDGVYHIDGVCEQPDIVELTRLIARQSLLQAECGYATNPVLSAGCTVPLAACSNYCVFGDAAIGTLSSSIENANCLNSKLEQALAEGRCDGTRDTAVALLTELGEQCREELGQ